MIGAEVRDSCGSSGTGETPQGSRTARGKRVPHVPINVQIVQAIKKDKLDFEFVYSLRGFYSCRILL
ncbi:hypothetical protein [Peribacillus frigoritolerans]|uniref:hypothetical protein n=1 Tax=Peribacillus frigoritolerans TaxID=450367 RepID=UPI0039A205C1